MSLEVRIRVARGEENHEVEKPFCNRAENKAAPHSIEHPASLSLLSQGSFSMVSGRLHSSYVDTDSHLLRGGLAWTVPTGSALLPVLLHGLYSVLCWPGSTALAS